jgi:hypothetical protein
MIAALRVVGRAVRLWWGEFFMLTFFNLSWLILQVPIVTGPPATAAMYLIARRVVDEELLDPRHGWQALRQVYWPAIKWGLANMVIAVFVVGNFWAYRAEIGLSWTVLRLVWGMIAVAWFAANLFYWPFWLAQEERSVWTTLRNSLVFMTKRPILAMTLTVISATLIIGGVLTTLPLAAALMAWLALISVLAIGEELG